VAIAASTSALNSASLPSVLRDLSAPFMVRSCITGPAAINWNGATDRSCLGSSVIDSFCNTGTAGKLLPARVCCATGEACVAVWSFSVVFKTPAVVKCLLVQDMKKYLVVASWGALALKHGADVLCF